MAGRARTWNARVRIEFTVSSSPHTGGGASAVATRRVGGRATAPHAAFTTRDRPQSNTRQRILRAVCPFDDDSRTCGNRPPYPAAPGLPPFNASGYIARLAAHHAASWRGGREAEGTGLLNRHTGKLVSRVRIPPSPLRRPAAEATGLQSGEGGIRTLDTSFPVCRFSKPVPSASRPPLQDATWCAAKRAM